MTSIFQLPSALVKLQPANLFSLSFVFVLYKNRCLLSVDVPHLLWRGWPRIACLPVARRVPTLVVGRREMKNVEKQMWNCCVNTPFLAEESIVSICARLVVGLWGFWVKLVNSVTDSLKQYLSKLFKQYLEIQIKNNLNRLER